MSDDTCPNCGAPFVDFQMMGVGGDQPSPRFRCGSIFVPVAKRLAVKTYACETIAELRAALAAREPAQAVAVPEGFALIDVAKIRVALSVLAGLREIEWGEESGQPYSKIAAVENTIEFALEDGRACSRTAERIPHGLAERVVRMMHLASIGAERAPNDRGEWNRLVAEIRAMLAAAKEGKPS
jgi:hypothetical protein